MGGTPLHGARLFEAGSNFFFCFICFICSTEGKLQYFILFEFFFFFQLSLVEIWSFRARLWTGPPPGDLLKELKFSVLKLFEEKRNHTFRFKTRSVRAEGGGQGGGGGGSLRETEKVVCFLKTTATLWPEIWQTKSLSHLASVTNSVESCSNCNTAYLILPPCGQIYYYIDRGAEVDLVFDLIWFL